MPVNWNIVILSQFKATIEMFGNAIRICPDGLWTARMWSDPNAAPEFSEFWYVTYHTLFWLDLYLTGTDEGFSPPAPFGLGELDPKGLLPERVYTRVELLSYLEHCQAKCTMTIRYLTDEEAQRLCVFPWSKGDLTFVELLLDNMRHVQEHGAQLHMYLGQQAGITSHWIGQGKTGEK